MKRILIILFTVVIWATSCNSPAQNEAESTAKAIDQAMQDFGPGQVAVSPNGYLMKAMVDGKPWEAKSMMQINGSNENYVRGVNADTEISFYIDRDHMVVGKPRKFYEGHVANFSIGDQIMSGHQGEWVITRADDNAIEGTFHFVANGFQSDKTSNVTNGFFRVLLK